MTYRDIFPNYKQAEDYLLREGFRGRGTPVQKELEGNIYIIFPVYVKGSEQARIHKYKMHLDTDSKLRIKVCVHYDPPDVSAVYKKRVKLDVQ